MKILILTLGTRGDVQPYVALGAGLKAAGHQVTLATVGSFAAMAQEAGLDFAPLRGEFLEMMQTPEGRAAVAGKANILKLMQMVQPLYRDMLNDELTAAAGADLMIFHPKAMGGHSLAEKLGIPGILALPLPLYSPTRAFPSPALPVTNLGPLNKASHMMLVGMASSAVRGTVNRWRREVLELGPAGSELTLHGRPTLRLYGYSATVLPTPADWDAHSVATGYWFLERPTAWQAPADLLAFLRAGPKPVYVGFGSMPAQDATALTKVVLGALAQSGQRGVLASGWGGLTRTDLPAHVYMLDAAPHDWLFPQMAAVVHHGGAGTTAAGLRAGVPSVICPFFADQPFWGRRVAALGAGPDPLPLKRLTAEALGDAISAVVRNASMSAAAQDLGVKLRAENGVARAVALIEAHAASARTVTHPMTVQA